MLKMHILRLAFVHIYITIVKKLCSDISVEELHLFKNSCFDRKQSIYDVLHDLVPFVQFKYPWRNRDIEMEHWAKLG